MSPKPLIELKTNLKSLKFGIGRASDRPGGGYSNQPYIIKDIPPDDSDSSNVFNTGGPDSLLRGGLIAPIKAVNDVSRLTQMFFDLKSPNGLLFIAKQNTLSRSSVKTEASIGPGTGGGNVNQGIYLPSSTIAQAGVGFTGTHLNLLGLNPASPGLNNNNLLSQIANGGLVKYETVALANNAEDVNKFTTGKVTTTTPNPLYNPSFGQKQILGSEQPFNETEFTSTSEIVTKGNFQNRLLKIWNKTQTSPSTGDDLINIVEPYGGGPGSILGIGKTYTRFADQRTGLNNPLAVTNKDYFWKGEGKATKITYADLVLGSGASKTYTSLLDNQYVDNIDNDFSQGNGFNVYENNGKSWPTTSPLQTNNSSSTYNQLQIISEPLNSGALTGNPKIKDFRKTLIDDKSPNSTILSLAPGYGITGRKALDERVNHGSPGLKNTSNSYTVGNVGGDGKPIALDKINASGFFDGKTPTTNEYRNDLVKFSIGILKNDGSGESTYMHFRSFIDSFSDVYSSEWGDVQYIGRGDKFHNYKGYSRTINMNWTCYAQSKPELTPMYKKLNFLASSLAPDYSSGGFMRGNLARLTVGGYLYNQLGIIKSLTYTVPQESTWEIGINTDGDSDNTVKELPHMIKVTGFSFTPIEDSLPKLRSKFIALSDGITDLY